MSEGALNSEQIAELLGTVKITGLEEAAAGINKFIQGMKKLQDGVDQNVGGAEDKVNSFMQLFGKTADEVDKNCKRMFVYFASWGASITAIFYKGEKSFEEYEVALTGLSHKLQGTASENKEMLKSMASEVDAMAIKYGQSNTVLLKQLEDLLGAGFKPAEALKILGESAKLAASQFVPLVNVVPSVTQILQGFNLKAENAAAVVDLLAAASDRTKVPVDALAGGIAGLAYNANAVGFNLQDLTAALLAGSKAGVPYERMMMGLGLALRNLAAPSDAALKAAYELGIGIDQESLKSKGLIGLLEELAGKNKTGAAATGEQMKAIFGSSRALMGILPLMDDINRLQEAYNVTTGAAGKADEDLAKAHETLRFALDVLGASMQQLYQNLFKPIAPIVKDLAANVSMLAQSFNQLSPVVQTFLSISLALTGVLMSFLAALALTGPALIAIGGTLLGGTGIIVAVALLGAGLITLVTRWEDVKKAVQDAGSYIEGMTQSIARQEKILTGYNEQVKTIDALIAKFKDLKAEEAGLQKEGKPLADVHAKLREVMEQMLTVAPQLIEQYDTLSGTFEINKKAAIALKDELRAMTLEALTTEQSIMTALAAGAEAEYNRAKDRRALIDDEIKEASKKATKLGTDFAHAQGEVDKARAAGLQEYVGSFSGGMDKIEQKTIEEATIAAETARQQSDASQVVVAGLRTEQAVLDATIKKRDDYLARAKAIQERINEMLGQKPGEAKPVTNVGAEEAAKRSKAVQDAANEAVLEGARIREAALHGEEKTWQEWSKEIDKASQALAVAIVAGAGADIIKPLQENLDKAVAGYQKAVKEVAATWDQYYSDQERLSGKTTDEIIDDIQRRIDKMDEEGQHGSADYQALCDKLLDLTEESVAGRVAAENDARKRISDIWDGVNEDFQSAESDYLANLVLCNESAGDSFDNFWKRVKESFVNGFADAMVQKLGFDLKFKNNMLDLGGFASSIFGGGEGGGGGLLGGISGFFSSIFGGGEAAGPAVWAASTTEATEAVAGSFDEAAVAASQADANVAALGTSAAGTTTAIEGTNAAITKAGSGLAGLNLALPAVGVYLAAATGQFGEIAQKISFVGTEAAALYAILGPLGALAGGVAGTLLHFGTQWAHDWLGIGSTHVSFEEQFGGYLEDLKEGTKTQEAVFQQLYLRTTNYANDFWGTQDNLLKKSYADRLAYYNKFANLKDEAGVSLFSDEQLANLKDALQLYETVTERGQAAQRTAAEVAKQTFDVKLWESFKDVPFLIDQIGGVGDAFKDAFNEAKASGGDFTAIFKAKLMTLPGISKQALDLVLEAFGQTTSEIKDVIDTVGGPLGDMWKPLTQGIKDAGADSKTVFHDIEAAGSQWLQGWDIDIKEVLMRIPGMTEEVRDEIVRNLRSLKEAGTKEFNLGDEFRKQVEDALNNPELLKDASDSGKNTASAWLKNLPATFKTLSKPLGQLLTNADLVTEEIRKWQEELDKTGKSAENAGDEMYSKLHDALMAIPGMTEDMVNDIETIFKAGDYDVKTTFTEEGWAALLKKIQEVENAAAAVTEPTWGSVGAGSGRGAMLAALNTPIRLPELSAASVTSAIESLLKVPSGINPAPQLQSMMQSGPMRLPMGGGGVVVHVTANVTVDSTQAKNKEYWRRVTRDEILPEMVTELSRKGIKLGV